jgi:hypothetical protein
MNMKIRQAIKAIAAFALLASGAANATESAVFVDDDPGANLAGVTIFTGGPWTESTFFPTTYGQGYHFTFGAGTVTMRSNRDIDESGGGPDSLSGSQFQAFARWSSAPNRCAAVRIEVRNTTTNTLITFQTVNQTIRPQSFNWNPIGGRFTATPNHLYEIRVIAPGGCVTTVDGGMFAQQTYDSSDVFNLTALSTIDEHGVEFDNSPTAQTAVNLDTVTTNGTFPTILKSVSVQVPDSVVPHYVICRAAGRVRFTAAQKWVLFELDNASTGTSEETWRYTASTTATFPASYENFAMQHVYTIGSEGGTFAFFLRAHRQDIAADGFLWTDDFTCEVTSTRY